MIEIVTHTLCSNLDKSSYLCPFKINDVHVWGVTLVTGTLTTSKDIGYMGIAMPTHVVYKLLIAVMKGLIYVLYHVCMFVKRRGS